MHKALTISELLNLIFCHLLRPRDIVRVALVSRMFSMVALRILWQHHQFSLGPLLRCVPYRSTLANAIDLPISEHDLAAWRPFRQYARSMSILSYSDRHDRYDTLRQSLAVSSILYIVKKHLPFAPLFPLLKRLAINISQPGWVEDLLPYISTSNLRFLSVQYNGAKHTDPQRILDLIANLLESVSSLRVMKLKIRSDFRLQPELFINSKDHLHLQHLALDCISLSAPSLYRVGQFPSLRRLKIRVHKRFPELFKNSIALSRLSRLELTASGMEIAVAFLGCIKDLTNVTDVIISIEEILPFEPELQQVSREIHRLCSPKFLQFLNISFNDFRGSRCGAPPPLMPENPGFTLQTFLPLITNFSLRMLNVSLQLPFVLASRNLTEEMASAWKNLISIRIDPGHIIPQDGDAAIPFRNLVPFFRVCRCLRQLYILFQHTASDHLPCIPATTFLYDLGLGYILPRSEEILLLATWLRVVAPALPEVSLVDGRGEIIIYCLQAH